MQSCPNCGSIAITNHEDGLWCRACGHYSPKSKKDASLTVQDSDNLDLKLPCGAPAPAVINGALFIGCQLNKDHDGPHKVEITWSS